MNFKVEKVNFTGKVLMVKYESDVIPLVQAYIINDAGFYEQVEVQVTFKDGYIIIESIPFDGELVVR